MIKIAKKRKISKKAMIIAIIICISIIIIIAMNSLKKLSENENREDSEIAELTQNSKTDEDIANENNYRIIKQEYEDDVLCITCNLDRDLYTNNNSNKEYFENLIENLTKIHNVNFAIIDQNRKIRIDVIYDANGGHIYKINDKENYFDETEKYNKQLKEYEKIPSKDVRIAASNEEIKNFKETNWLLNGSGNEALSKDDNYVYFEKFKTKMHTAFIDTAIYGTDFQEDIINGLKVNSTRNEIIERLGEPTVEQRDMLGYKLKDAYIFFYEDEVAVCPNIEYEDNRKVEKVIKKLIDGEYEKRNLFAFDMLNVYLFRDFNSYIDEKDSLIVFSPTRGIKIEITKDNLLQIYIYNNYDMTENTKKYILDGVMTLIAEEDYVIENEKNRR